MSVTTLPAAPSTLVASATNTTTVRLTWVNHSAGQSGFVIERATGAGTFTQIDSVGAGASSYDDSGATEGTAYTYRVRAADAGGNSSPSNTATVTTYAAAPTGLTAAASGPGHVNLSWADHSAAATGYRVERSTDGVSFTVIDSIATGSTSYDDASVGSATTYTYRVVAYNAAGDSAFSQSPAVLTQPGQVGGIVAAAIDDTSIRFTWNAVAGATRYQVYHASGEDLTLDADVAGNVTTAVVSGLSPASGGQYLGGGAERRGRGAVRRYGFGVHAARGRVGVDGNGVGDRPDTGGPRLDGGPGGGE